MGSYDDQKYGFHLDRANYYVEQEGYRQALNELVQAFSYLYYMFLPIKQPKREETIDLLFAMAIVMANMLSCYCMLKELDKGAFLSRDYLEVYRVLGQYEKFFTELQLRAYANLSSTKIQMELVIVSVKKIELEKGQIDVSFDETFYKLYENFNNICSLEICPLSKRSIPGETGSYNSSSDFNWQSSILSLLAFFVAFFMTGKNIVVGIIAAIICWIVVSSLKEN